VVALVVGLAGAFGGTFVDMSSADGSESAEAVQLLEERFPAAAGGKAYQATGDNTDPSVKMIGVRLAAAIAIDATLVRLVLVPAAGR